MGKNLSKDINKILRRKHSQKRLDHAEKSATDALKTTTRKDIQRTAEGTVNLIGNEIADKVTNVSKCLPHNNFESETEVPKEIYITQKEKQQIIDELRLI